MGRKVLQGEDTRAAGERPTNPTAAALRLLRHRCGPLPKRLDSKVRALTIPELADLAGAGFDLRPLPSGG